jgi:hypothetical protein
MSLMLSAKRCRDEARTGNAKEKTEGYGEVGSPRDVRHLEQIASAKTEIARLKGEKESFEQCNEPGDADEEELKNWNYAKDIERQIRELKVDNRDALRELVKAEKAAAKRKATDADRRAACAAKSALQPALEQIAALESALAPYEKIKTDLTAARTRFRKLSDAFVSELKNRRGFMGDDRKRTLVLEVFAEDVQGGLDAGSETDIEHGFAFDGRLFTDKPIGPTLLVRGNFHRDAGLYFTDENTKYFGGKFLPETVLVNGDVLIVMTDLSPMTLILGKTVMLNEPFPVLHNQRIGKFRFKQPNDWNPEFFVSLMNDERVRRKVIREATGTTVRHTSPDRIQSALGVKPGRKEQDQIVSMIQTFDSAATATAKELTKLAAIKCGLMNDLLTGRVRVPEGVAVTG